MPTNANPRKEGRWNRATWIGRWVLAGRPQQLPLLDLLTIPEEAFEHHRYFYSGARDRPIAQLSWSREYSPGELPRECLHLYERLKHRGLPAWWGRIIRARAKRPQYYTRQKRRRPGC